VSVERRTRVYTHGALLPYPFQANLHGLPLEVVQECLVGFVEARERAARGELPAASFEAFAEARFGRGIARHFFVPYNTKLWGMHPNRLTAEWVSRYIPIPDLAQVIGGAIGVAQEGLGYNANFLYPAAGGIDALPRRLAAALPETVQTILGSDVEAIDPAGRRVKLTAEADWRGYAALISTMPLPELVRRIAAVPAAVREAAAALRWVRWRYLDVATRRPVPADYHWAYVPELRYPFFRVGVYSNAVASMAPAGCSSLYVELSDRTGPIDVPAVLQALVEVGALAAVDDVLFTEEREIEYAYVVFDDDHAAATRTIFAWLAQVGIHSCGRYGAWVYNSMEDSVIQGREAAGVGHHGGTGRKGQVGMIAIAPELSVIIPVYNEEAILASSVLELMRGLDAAGLAAHEIVIAENGSRDRTREIAAELAAAHPRVRTFSCAQPNYGAALREGIEGARGEYVLCEEIDLCDVDFHTRALKLLRAARSSW
jgi:protoporphyrinogen oxidase